MTHLAPPRIVFDDRSQSAPALEKKGDPEDVPLLHPSRSQPDLEPEEEVSVPALRADPSPLPFTHRVASRFLLRHVVDHRPIWHIIRVMMGAVLVMVINKVAGCTDDLSAVFNFFLCICAFSGSTLMSIREVLVGGFIGTAFGVAFAALTRAVSGMEFYEPSWQVVWTVPLCITVQYYLILIVGLSGPDKLQLLSAVTSAVLIVTIPFPYPPLVPLVGQTSWGLLTQSLLTRAISLTNGCTVALVFRSIGKLMIMAENACRRKKLSGEAEDEEDDEQDLARSTPQRARPLRSSPSLTPHTRRSFMAEHPVTFQKGTL